MTEKNSLLVSDDPVFRSGIHPLWLRIAAFLEMRSENTRRTYTGIVKEWALFLGAEPGTAEAAQKIIRATDLHAVAYKRWLEEQPGQNSRLMRSEVRSNLPDKIKNTRERRDGTQKGLANSTIHKKFAALRRIYRTLIAADLGID